MSSEKEEPNTFSTTYDDMENVELHRAESMIKEFPPDIPEQSSMQQQAKNETVFSVVASFAISLFNEIKELKLEVVIFLYMFSSTMRQVSGTTMIMEKVCLVHMNLSPETCANLEADKILKTKIEKITNNYSLGHGLMQLIPSAIMGLFVGPWSDKYGRKIPLIAGLLGMILDGLGSTICAAVLYSRADYYLLPALFTGLSGGMISVLTVLYSYASDITPFNKRTMKYAVMEVFFGLAMPLGSFAGGWIYKYSSYFMVFVISTGGHVMGLAWVLFILVETRGLDNNDSWKVKLRNLFRFESVVEGFRETTKKRLNRGREQILFLILAMSISVLSYAATASIGYLYVYHRYSWGNTKYSTVSAIFSVIGTSSLLIIVPIFKKFKLGDATLGLVGSISLLVKNIVIGFATSEHFYYLGSLLGLLNGLATLAGRSRISKVCSKDDLGKVFSFLSSAESVLPIIAVAVVSQLYNASLEFSPGLTFFILGGVMIIPLLIFIWLGRLPNADYEMMHNNVQSEGIVEEEKSSKA